MRCKLWAQQIKKMFIGQVPSSVGTLLRGGFAVSDGVADQAKKGNGFIWCAHIEESP